MAWTKYQVFLALMLVFTGSINTLATKWADSSLSVGRDGKLRLFDHPFLQAVGMFLGEMSCLLAFRVVFFYYTRKAKAGEAVELPPSVSGSRDFNPLIFLPPAMCDLVGTSIMYIGLNLTYASSFQMLRGAVIIFTGLLSVAFLGRRLRSYEWIGILGVMCGLVVVGLSDILFPDSHATKGPNSIITGDLLIVLAQVITASQMVIEEKFVTKYKVAPLQAVGWEGFFGFVVLGTLLVPMYFIPAGNTIFQNPGGQLEDAIDGFIQIKNSWHVALGVVGTVLSIAFFNFAGISVTKELSATTRMVLDSVRTLVIWLFSLAVRWQGFNWTQIVGFVVLILGMFLYNNVIIRPFLIKRGCLRDTDSQDDLSGLIQEERPPGTSRPSSSADEANP
ncbi:transport and golgi organization 9 isoform X1 [Rhipicephalus microplus]|uniref:Putative solute carrier family 35 member f6 n=2 Tax=Rhipicephalus microplus TaxID=6941 RepID=A0A6M2CJ57_RHIMP|nr:solute carrier family 35 member F6-like [Rhipicephalus microplus]